MTKPVYYKALSSFNKDENISDSYVINMSLNERIEGIYFLPACLVEKIFELGCKEDESAMLCTSVTVPAAAAPAPTKSPSSHNNQ